MMSDMNYDKICPMHKGNCRRENCVWWDLDKNKCAEMVEKEEAVELNKELKNLTAQLKELTDVLKR